METQIQHTDSLSSVRDETSHVTENLPAPPVPSNCDLRKFNFLPLDVIQLRDSQFAIKVSSDEFRAAIVLWCISWHQVPAGSLPNDDVALAKLAGFGRMIKAWKKVRAGALYGFILCSDGRLYHSVLCEKALQSWKKYIEQKKKHEEDRARKSSKRKANSAGIPADVLRNSSGQIENSSGIPAENALNIMVSTKALPEVVHDVSNNPFAKKAAKEKKASRKRKPDLYFEAVCEACKLDWKTIADSNRGELNQTCKILQAAGYTIPEIKMAGRGWYFIDWRGKQGQAPTPTQLRVSIRAILESDWTAEQLDRERKQADRVKRQAIRREGTTSDNCPPEGASGSLPA